MDNTVNFILELGIDAGKYGRRCALEVGPFDTSIDARRFADAARDRSIHWAEQYAQSLGLSTDPYDREPGDENMPIIGATINLYTDAEGTIEDIDLY